MQLIADRFVMEENGSAWDLATGVRVTIVMSTAGGPGEQAAWAERCAWLSTVVHVRLAPLVDYGAIGEAGRFEAWGATVPWAGAAASAVLAASTVQAFFAGHGRAGGDERPVVGVVDGRAVVVPGASAGRVASAVESDDQTADSMGGTLDVCGRLCEPDKRLMPLFDLLESQQQAPPAIGVWLPPAVERAPVVRQLARASRLGGRVPVDARFLRDTWSDLVRGRSLAILSMGDPATGWQALMQAALASGRPHLVCFVGEQVVRRVHTVGVAVPTADALAASVVPRAVATRHVRTIATAARRARGSGARFGRILFDAVAPDELGVAAPSAPGNGQRAAEDRAADRGGLVTRNSDGAVEAARRAWPAPGELLRLRKQGAQVSALLDAGRHRAGERLARQVMHALARRAQWTDAVHVALQLARALRRRGRSADALEVCDTLRGWTGEAADIHSTLAVARTRAAVLIDRGQLTEAEAVLEPALAAAASQDHQDGLDLLVEFARSLHWQGRDAEAAQRLTLAAPAADADAGAAVVRLWLVRSVIATACGRLADGIALASRARDRAHELAEPELIGLALERCAEVQLTAGDASAARTIAAGALPYARRAHAPMLAMRLRVLAAEAARRLGDRRVAVTCLARYARTTSRTLPTLERARVSLLKVLLDASSPAAAAVGHAESTGLAGLRHYGPAPPAAVPGGTATPDDLVELLHCCQVAQDDRAVLAAVCARLRARLGAAGVGFLVEESGQYALTSADGQRPDGRLAVRVAAAQQLVMDDAGGTRPEAGVPVRFVGGPVGVLVAVWGAGSHWHAPDVAMLLSTGATAAGPALAAVKAARATDRRTRMAELIGNSAAVGEIRAAIERAAPAPFPVLVDGESGVGKELVARLLHKMGVRRDRPFATMNCAALPDDLVESELFGHARGAFTGAVAERRGLFEDAHGGTLFLDEVGELSLRAQAKLLRVIQEGELRRVGENVSRRVDVRLVAATNRHLRSEVAAGRFRLDLLYRLDVLRITIPPLRERRDDIPLLAEHLWRDAAGRLGSQAVLAPATLDALARHDWPGNVRELQNVLAALAVRCGRRGLVLPSSLPTALAGCAPRPLRLEEARLSFDRAFISSALARTGGRRSRAARELGVSRQGLAKLMARLEIAEDAAAVDDGL